MAMNNRNLKDDFQLSLAISDYDVSHISNEVTVLFRIELFSPITNKEWVVNRTLSNFRQLNKILEKSYLNVPNFPSRIFINSNEDANAVRIILQKWLLLLVELPELVNSTHLKQFLELENHISDYMTFQPILINEITDNSMEVTSIAYCFHQNLLFAGCAYSSSPGGISSYFSSISSLFNNTNLGILNIFHLAKSSYGEIHSEKIFSQQLQAQISKINYNDGLNLDLLTVGLYDGHILIFKIYTNLDKYISKNLVDQIAKIQPHKNRILDTMIDPNFGYIYSAAEGEKNIAICEINYESVIKSIPVSNYSLSGIYFEKETKRIFASDSASSIWILQIEEKMGLGIKFIQAVHHPNNGLPGISCIRIEPDRNFIFIGTCYGVIKFYDFDYEEAEVGKKADFKVYERLTIPILSHNKVKINEIRYRSAKSGLITALSNGSVAFWSHNPIKPEFVLDCHEKSVNQILFDNNDNLLFTCSSDKTIKIWHLPMSWPSELMRLNPEINDISIIEQCTENKHNITRQLQDALKKIDFDKQNSGLGSSFKSLNRKDSNVKSEGENNTNADENEYFGIERKTGVQSKGENKENQVESPEEELIDTNYMYDEDNKEDDNQNFLDGWENEIPLEEYNFRNKSKINLLYDFMNH